MDTKSKGIVSGAICFLGLMAGACSMGKTATESNETVSTEILYADPTIFVENGKYYLSGTRGETPRGFALLESENLTDWQAMPDSMILTASDATFGTKGFWAPQILKTDEGYALAYTANTYLAYAKCDSLKGPYTQEKPEAIDTTNNNIDPFIFTDSDGKSYLYHVRFNNGNYLWVAEFDTKSGKINYETLTKCFDNDQPWEATDAFESVPIMEGPTVIRLGDTYYLFYSANDYRSIDYSVGYATATSPLGPWTKNPNNPIIHRSIVGENGSGHGDIFTDLNGNMRYVYHVHNSDSVVHPRRTRIITLQKQLNDNGSYDITADSTSIIKPKQIITNDIATK